MDQKNIGSFITSKRRERNLTQEQLAEKLGVSNKTISKWENGRCLPDYSIIEALCKMLDVSISELLEGKEISNKTYMSDDCKLLLYRLEELENKKEADSVKTLKQGITLGSALAIVISYVNWHSVGWAVIHGLMSWGYVIYYLIKY